MQECFMPRKNEKTVNRFLYSLKQIFTFASLSKIPSYTGMLVLNIDISIKKQKVQDRY